MELNPNNQKEHINENAAPQISSSRQFHIAFQRLTRHRYFLPVCFVIFWNIFLLKFYLLNPELLIIDDELSSEIEEELAMFEEVQEGIGSGYGRVRRDREEQGSKDTESTEVKLKAKTDSNFKELQTWTPTNTPPNQKLFFHNKMPRCGSTTMRNILSDLSIRNNFNFIMILAKEKKYLNSEADLVELIENRANLKPDLPALAMKHNTFVNFTIYGFEQPTFFNVVRNPIDRYLSSYYTCRNGMEGQNGMKGNACKDMTEGELKLSADDYFRNLREGIHGGHITGRKKKKIRTGYCHWLCGAHEICQYEDSKKKKHLTYDYTKKLILKSYYTIGVLEKLKDTLKLFEKLLPDLYEGGLTVFEKSEKVKKTTHSSATKDKKTISNETRVWLEETHFKYDIDLYRFIVARFNMQFEKFVLGE